MKDHSQTEQSDQKIRATWNGKLIAESDKTIIVEGNNYFPPDAVNRNYLAESDHHTHCPWKGEASYYHLQVDGKTNENAAWYYPEPFEKAKKIKDYIAFWKGVDVKPAD